MDANFVLKSIGKDLQDGQLYRLSKIKQIDGQIKSKAITISTGTTTERVIEIAQQIVILTSKLQVLEAENRLLEALYQKIGEQSRHVEPPKD